MKGLGSDLGKYLCETLTTPSDFPNEDTQMILQSENTSLTQKLHVAVLKVGATLLSVSLPTGGGNYSYPGKSVVSFNWAR